MNKTYRVSMVGQAVVRGVYRVKAKNADAAEAEALANLGDIVWEYDGLEKVVDELTAVEEVKGDV